MTLSLQNSDYDTCMAQKQQQTRYITFTTLTKWWMAIKRPGEFLFICERLRILQQLMKKLSLTDKVDTYTWRFKVLYSQYLRIPKYPLM